MFRYGKDQLTIRALAATAAGEGAAARGVDGRCATSKRSAASPSRSGSRKESSSATAAEVVSGFIRGAVTVSVCRREAGPTEVVSGFIRGAVTVAVCRREAGPTETAAASLEAPPAEGPRAAALAVYVLPPPDAGLAETGLPEAAVAVPAATALCAATEAGRALI